MSDDDNFTLRLMFDTGVSEDAANDIIVQSQMVTADDVWRIGDLGVRTVIDLTADGEVDGADREAARAALRRSGIGHVNVPVTGPSRMEVACAAVLGEVRQASPYGQAVLVHCQMGSDRSVCVATAVKAVRSGRLFAEQLAAVQQEFPDIAVSQSMVRAADAWVQQMTDGGLIDLGPDPELQCPRCRGEVVGGLCEGENCDRTVCPFCGDGRGAVGDGCPHLVLSLVGQHDHHKGAGVLAWCGTGNPRLLAAPLPYLVRATDADGAEALMADTFGTYPDPWPDGITRPPSRPDLLVMAAAVGQAAVRANAVMDWDEHLHPVPIPAARAYASDPDAVVARALEALRHAGTQLGQFGTVGWAEA